MNRRIYFLFLILFIVPNTWSNQPRRFYNPESVMAVWEEAIRSRDLDAFADCYWEDAAQWWFLPDGRMEQNEGIGSIIELQASIFEEAGQAVRRFRLSEPEIHQATYTGLPMFIYDNPDLGTTEVFWYGERAGRIRIERQFVILRYFEDIEAGAMQSWADENKDGLLQRHEQESVYKALLTVTQELHRNSNPLDQFCDWNRNGRIDETEMILARAVLVRDGLRRGFVYFPDFAQHYLDQNRSGSIDLGETEAVLELVYGERGDRPVESPLGERIDFITDGVITPFEQEVFARTVIRLVSMIPEWPVFEQLTDGSADWVVTWADANGDGIIGEEELWDIGRLMRGVMADTEVITSPVGLRYDKDRNLQLSASERRQAADEMLTHILPEALQIGTMSFERAATIAELDVDENGWLDPEEIETFGEIAIHPERLIGRIARTPLERKIDREPRDGRIDEWEVFSFAEAVFATIAEIWLLQSDKIGQTAIGLSSTGPLIQKEKYEPTGDKEEELDREIDESPVVSTGPTATGEVSDTLQTGSLSAAVTLYPVFPVLFKYHDTAPVGQVVIKNDMSVDAKNVQVKLNMQRYIDSPRVSASIDSIAAGEEKKIDLLALFNEDVLDLTEGTRCSAQVIIDYEDSAGRQQLAVTETLTFYDRNAIQWDDDAKVAAFVTARDPQIRLLATNMAALIRRYRNRAISENLQNAMVLYAALVQHNIGYNVDPSSSYKVLSKDSLSIDYVQFPRQTLMFKGGDCDDLSVCYTSLLETLGIPSAFITIPGHIYVAFGLKMDASTAKARFSDPEDLIFAQDGTVWVPVEITKLNDANPDFLDAWAEGAKEWREHNSRGQAILIPTREAWKTYEPVAASFMTDSVALPDTEKVLDAFQSDLTRFVNLEIADQELTLQGRLSSDSNNPRLLNLLGTLYARYGLTEKAHEKFKVAVAGQEYFAALMNLGHLDFLAEEYVKAATYYQRAITAQPNSPRAVLALARTDHELENYGNVRRHYENLQKISPKLAADYSYLDLRASESVRAQESTRLRNFVIWEIEESE